MEKKKTQLYQAALIFFFFFLSMEEMQERYIRQRSRFRHFKNPRKNNPIKDTDVRTKKQ